MQTPSPAEILRQNRDRAKALSDRIGTTETRRILEQAVRELEERLRTSKVRPAADQDEPFTIAEMRVTLAQLRDVLRSVKGKLRGHIVSSGTSAAEGEASDTVEYLERAERNFRGINRPLGLDQARIVNRAVASTESSILNRIGADPTHPGNTGVLDRYGDNVIKVFEEKLSTRLVARKSWADVRKELIDSSPFLKEQPLYWAERIVRTETMHANNRAGHEVIAAADAELGDMAKILVATFDSRTCADSYAVHGQIRKPTEMFDTWQGPMMHPPARPNDRETVIPHRIAWPIPTPLKWKTDSEVAARWAWEGRKGSPPTRPKMTTIPLDKFGKRRELPPEELVPEPVQEQPQEPTVEQQPSGVQIQEHELQRDPNEPVMMMVATPATPGVPIPPQPGLEPVARRVSDAEYARRGREAFERDRVGSNSDFVRPPIELSRDLDDATYAKAFDALKDLQRELERARRAGEPTTSRAVRLDTVRIAPSHVPAEAISQALRPRSRKERENDVPQVVRRGRELVAVDDRSAALLLARRYEGRKSTPVHVVDIDPKKRPQPPPEPEKPAMTPPKVEVRKVDVDTFIKDRRVVGNDAREAFAKVFGTEAPDLDSFQKVWGNAATGHEIELTEARLEASWDGKSASFTTSGRIRRKAGTYEYTEIQKDPFTGKDTKVTKTMVVPEGGQRIGSITRTFKRHADGTLEVHHDYFKIDDVKHQGGGLGEAMLRQSVQTYEAIGVDEITIDCAWVGQYTWATFGYDWRSEEQRDEKKRSLEEFLKRKASLPAERAKAIAATASRHSWDVAALDVDGIEVPVRSEGRTMNCKVGKAYLLSDQMWSGVLNLKDKNSPSYQRAKKRLKL